MSEDRRSTIWVSFALAFVGGYGDAAGFILANTFTGHVTGNLVLTAISVAGQEWQPCFRRLWAIALFLAGTLFSATLERFVARRAPHAVLPVTMVIEIVLFSTAYFALTSHLAVSLGLFVGCLSLALGLQNGAFCQAAGISVHTTYLTGTITSLLMAVAQRHRSPAAQARHRESARDPAVNLLFGIWLSFVLGAGIGAAMVFRFQALGIFGAAFLLLIIIPIAVAQLSPS